MFSWKKGSKKAKITKRSHTYKGYSSTYNVEIVNSFNSELQLKDNKSAIRNKLNALLTELKVFKFVKILFLKFRKIENDYETKHLLLKAEHIIETDIDNIFGSICSIIIQNLQKLRGNGSNWITDSVIDPTINISKYKPLSRSS